MFTSHTLNVYENVLGCSEEEAEKVGLALDKYFVPLDSKFYKIDDSTYSFVDAGRP